VGEGDRGGRNGALDLGQLGWPGPKRRKPKRGHWSGNEYQEGEGGRGKKKDHQQFEVGHSKVAEANAKGILHYVRKDAQLGGGSGGGARMNVFVEIWGGTRHKQNLMCIMGPRMKKELSTFMWGDPFGKRRVIGGEKGKNENQRLSHYGRY